jgi:hypothetical protein
MLSTELQLLVGRGQPVEGPEGPIIVCTRNEELENVVNATPEHRREGVCCHVMFDHALAVMLAEGMSVA